MDRLLLLAMLILGTASTAVAELRSAAQEAVASLAECTATTNNGCTCKGTKKCTISEGVPSEGNPPGYMVSCVSYEGTDTSTIEVEVCVDLIDGIEGSCYCT